MSPVTLPASSPNSVGADPNLIVNSSSEMHAQKGEAGNGNRINLPSNEVASSRGEADVLAFEGNDLILGAGGNPPRHPVRLQSSTCDDNTCLDVLARCSQAPLRPVSSGRQELGRQRQFASHSANLCSKVRRDRREVDDCCLGHIGCCDAEDEALRLEQSPGLDPEARRTAVEAQRGRTHESPA
jgi:hypothetical protein